MQSIKGKLLTSTIVTVVMVASLGVGYLFAMPRTQLCAMPRDVALASPAPSQFDRAPADDSLDVAVPDGQQTPAALAGTAVPRLPVDQSGTLRQVRDVRDFFDYFLTAQSELSPSALDKRVRDAVCAQLANTPAAAEALTVWKRYEDYRTVLDQMNAAAPADDPARFDPAAFQQWIDQRALLAANMLGPWFEPFFAREIERQRFDVARVRIESDTSLTNEQKGARIRALEESLPSSQRTAIADAHRTSASLDMLTDAFTRASPDQDSMRQLAQLLGDEPTARFAKLEASEHDWQARYTGYALKHDAIRAQYHDADEQREQLDALRRAWFPVGSDALRASSLDDVRS